MSAIKKLHKASKMRGLHVHATDGDIGHIDDLLLDESMTIRYLVLDTSNLPGGKAVLIPSSAVESIDSPGGHVSITLTRKQVDQSPPLEAANIELVETLKPTLI